MHVCFLCYLSCGAAGRSVASSMIGTVEGMLYAQKAGLDPLTVIKAVQVSSGTGDGQGEIEGAEGE